MRTAEYSAAVVPFRCPSCGLLHEVAVIDDESAELPTHIFTANPKDCWYECECGYTGEIPAIWVRR